MKSRVSQGKLLAALALSAAAWIVAAPAQANLIADGITYTLTDNGSAGALGEQYILTIQGINGAADTEKGRYGVHAFAFTQPANFVIATYVSGTQAGSFAFQLGGISSGGCDGHGNFFCFQTATPSGPALAANSSLQFIFDVQATTSLANWLPDFKIDWTGTKNNYDLVSLELAPTRGPPPILLVPEPATLALLGLGLAGLGFTRRQRKS